MSVDDQTVRLRLVFDNGLLTNSHASEGLHQCWILLKPQQLPTVSDLSSHLLRTFHLNSPCSHGLLLSMDGFVLPPFESTSILRDKDIISVKKRGIILSDAIDENPFKELVMAKEQSEEEGETDTEDNKIEYALPVKTSSGSKLVSKKRKQSRKLQSSNKKKLRLTVADAVENDAQTEDFQNHQSDGLAGKVAQVIAENGETVHGVERSDDLQKSNEGIADVIHVSEGTKKVPSRSARRKYAKRKWLKELKKSEKKDGDISNRNGLLNRKKERGKTKKEIVNKRPKGLLHWKKLPSIEQQKVNLEEDEQPCSDVVDDIVAVVVKPGHIRFGPPGIVEAEHAVIKSPVAAWSGSTTITSPTNKKMSRKNRKEKTSSSGGKINKQEWKKIYAQALATEKDLLTDFPADFENLPPLTTVAQEGDVIAYRVIELSSSWTPELSSLRVGKILWCDPQSTKIVMKPKSENKDENVNSEILSHPDGVLHDVDGNLEIDFKTLIDVRVVKHGDSAATEPNKAEKKEENPWERLINRELDPWERLSQASAYANRAVLYGEKGYRK